MRAELADQLGISPRAACSRRQVGEGRLRQRRDGGVSDHFPDEAERALDSHRTRFRMTAGRTPDRCELALKEADNPFERDLFWPPVESVTTVRTALGANDACAPHRRHDLLEH